MGFLVSPAIRQAVGLREGPVVVDPRCRPEAGETGGWTPVGGSYLWVEALTKNLWVEFVGKIMADEM